VSPPEHIADERVTGYVGGVPGVLFVEIHVDNERGPVTSA